MADRRQREDGDEGPGRIKLIACPAVLGELAEGALDGLEVLTLEGQLHLSPERLRAALAELVAAADEPDVTIVIGYGLCSNAVLGLKTEHATLVVPRVDDCIAMLLGSNAAFAAQSAETPGTYYLSRSYIEVCDTVMSDHDKMAARRGPERAEQLTRLLLAHYTRIAMIQTGRHDLTPYRPQVEEFAQRFGLAVEDIPGTTRLIDQLVEGGWGDDFVIAPPGHELTLADFHPELFASSEPS